MEKIRLYRYTRHDGGVSVSPREPQGEYTTLWRLVAGEGCVLTDGTHLTACLDTDAPEGWVEITEPDEP